LQPAQAAAAAVAVPHSWILLTIARDFFFSLYTHVTINFFFLQPAQAAAAAAVPHSWILLTIAPDFFFLSIHTLQLKKNLASTSSYSATQLDSIDIDGLDLFLELKVLRKIIQTEENKNTPIDILNYIKKLESFPNASIAYRILLTILVTVASAKRTFSKLKLIKSYLRSTMSQERLSGLAILSIEKNMLEKIDYKSLINNFESKRARKMKF
jgi:hypothetical protein